MKGKLSDSEIKERNRFFHLALQEEDQNHLKKALDFYRMSLKVDTNFFDSWLNAGAIYSRSGKTQKAVTCFQRAIISRPDKRAYYNLALEYFKQERFYHALDTIKRAVEMDSQFLQGYLLAGYCYGKVDEPKQAEKSILSVLKIDPSNYQAMNALALLYFQQNRYSDSLRYVNYLLAKNPQDLSMQRVKASLALEQDDLQASVLAFREIAERDPKLKSMYVTLDKELSGETKAKMLHNKMELAEKKSKNAQDYLDLSLLSLFSGEPSRAMDYLLKVTQKSQAK